MFGCIFFYLMILLFLIYSLGIEIFSIIAVIDSHETSASSRRHYHQRKMPRYVRRNNNHGTLATGERDSGKMSRTRRQRGREDWNQEFRSSLVLRRARRQSSQHSVIYYGYTVYVCVYIYIYMCSELRTVRRWRRGRERVRGDRVESHQSDSRNSPII